MIDSILITIRKHVIGYEEENPVFDAQLIDEINSALWRLNQLGVGIQGFRIKDTNSKWEDFMGTDTNNISKVITYVKDSVRLSFDPPTNSFLVSAIKDRMEQTEWLLNVEVDPVYE